MSKHTPGPWAADVFESNRNGWSNAKQVVTITADDGHTVIALYSTEAVEYPNDESNVANARLIAAAPDLLEALKDATDMIETLVAHGIPINESGKDALASYNAAIAKAEGR